MEIQTLEVIKRESRATSFFSVAIRDLKRELPLFFSWKKKKKFGVVGKYYAHKNVHFLHFNNFEKYFFF